MAEFLMMFKEVSKNARKLAHMAKEIERMKKLGYKIIAENDDKIYWEKDNARP